MGLIVLNVPRLAEWSCCVSEQSFRGSERNACIFPVFPTSCLSLVKVLSVVAVSPPYMWHVGGVIALLKASEIVARLDVSSRAASASTRWGRRRHIQTQHVLLVERRPLTCWGGGNCRGRQGFIMLDDFGIYSHKTMGRAIEVLFLQRNTDVKMFHEV